MNRKLQNKRRITYDAMFWLLIVGSVAGLFLEGAFYKLMFGHFEAHVNTVWGPFCLIYGVGAVCLYVGSIWMEDRNLFIRFVVFTFIGTIVEYLCGALLRYRLHMKAWDYSHYFLNYKGLICLKMSLLWGVAGILFGFLCPLLDRVFAKMKGKYWHGICLLFTAFMIVNVIFTSGCIIRWADRHRGIPAKSQIGQMMDAKYDDERMHTIFCEWKFLEPEEMI